MGMSDSLERPIVVVADDDRAIRKLFRTVLEREGFAVRLAEDGREALELAREPDVAVLLLDINMPGMDGLEALRELRADRALQTLPVILVTGSTTEADRLEGIDSGADDVVIKPVSITELVDRVRAQLR